MFQSTIFRRLFFPILLIVLGSAVVIYFYSVPFIKAMIYKSEEDAARTILDNVYELVRSDSLAIEAYRKSALEFHKRQLKNITLIQQSFLQNKYAQFKRGEISEKQAKASALQEMRNFRYGNNDYVWVSDYKSRLISHPDQKLHNADFSQVKDVYGNYIVPPMVDVARKNGEGYTSYWWRRLGEERPIEKLTYSRLFPQWGWVIGTGVYIDDVEAEVARRKGNMIQELRQILRQIKIARTGYMYIFDSKRDMIIHPNANIEKTNIATLKDPATGRPIADELIAASRNVENKIYYKWDKPNDPGHYVYDKISWVKYFKGFDWYIASSVYTEELNSSAEILKKRILSVSTFMILLSVLIVSLFVSRFLGPIRRLSNMAQQVKNGNLTARCKVVGTDEIALLAATFNDMVEQIESSIENLDQKVRDRTQRLDENNALLVHEVTERERIGEELKRANEKLTIWVSELESHNREIALLNQMGDMLQACHTLEETFGVIAETVAGLFPGEAGAMFMNSATRNILEQVACWGGYAGNLEFFPREDCWCLRRGKVHQVERPGLGQVCNHIKNPPPFGSLCVPMVGQSEVLGMLHLEFAGHDANQSAEEVARLLDSRQRLAVTVADHLALALANLMLRERLHTLSVRDSLTGLFNRRYMVETLERETRWAKRNGTSTGIIMLDVDYFKQVNDEFGHEAGDLVLLHLSKLLQRSIRAEDVACRYGGEEFLLILPGATLEQTMSRAELIRSLIADGEQIDFQGKTLRVTISAGVAIYPLHGSDAETVINAADAALYGAKKTGRNRVLVNTIEV